jgi:anti-sigma factor RsiW
MNIDHESLQWNAFVDGELDLAGQLEFEQRLRDDAGLRARVEALRQGRALVRDGAVYHAAPAALRQRVAALVGAPATLRGRLGPVHALRWPQGPVLVFGIGLVAVLALALGGSRWQAALDERLMNEVVASHVRSTLGQHLVDIASSERHTVKPWLSSKLDFSPPVHELPLPGSAFLGGRVDYLDARPVATLVYRQGEHVVNAFVWPSSGADRAAEFFAQRGYQVAHWTRAGMTHWVISDLNREEFGAVVRSIVASE